MSSFSSSDVDSLVRDTLEAFSILEPFCTLEIDLDIESEQSSSRIDVQKEKNDKAILIRKFQDRVQKHTNTFFSAIDTSLDVSRRGSRICQSAIELSDYVSQGFPQKDILEFIGQMQKMAYEALREAKEMRRQFVDAKAGFEKIRKDILHALIEVRWYRFWAIFGQSATHLKDHSSEYGVVLALILSLAVPHLSLTIPVMIPVSALAVKGLGKAGEVIADRMQRKVEATGELHNMQKDLRKLCTRVDGFVLWWSTLCEEIDTIKALLEKKANEQVVSQLKGVGNRWQGLENSYLTYCSQIQELQDFYPASYRYRQKMVLSS